MSIDFKAKFDTMLEKVPTLKGKYGATLYMLDLV